MFEEDPATGKRGVTSEKEYLSALQRLVVSMRIEGQKAMTNTLLHEFNDRAFQGMRKRQKWQQLRAIQCRTRHEFNDQNTPGREHP